MRNHVLRYALLLLTITALPVWAVDPPVVAVSPAVPVVTPALAQVKGALVCARSGFTLEVGDQPPELVFSNFGHSATVVQLTAEIQEFDGAKRAHTAALTVVANGETRWRLPVELHGARLGIRWLRWAVEGGPHGRDRYAVIRSPGRAPVGYDGFHFGMNGGPAPMWTGVGERLGITLWRGGWQWALVQPKRDMAPAQWTWEAELSDRIVDQLREHGIAMHGIIGYNALWNAPESAKDLCQPRNPTGGREWDLIFTYPVDLVAYRLYVQEFLKRYGTRLWSVSPWNEPAWFGDVEGHPEWYPNETYLAMQRIVAEEARIICPKVKVGTGGFAKFDDPLALHDAVIRRAQGDYDLHVTHGHSHWPGFKNEVATVEAARRRHGASDKPFLFDETARAHLSNSPAEEVEVAYDLARMTPYLWSRGAVGHCWFEMADHAYVEVVADDNDDKKPGYERWGMYDRRTQPRAVAAAFAAQVGLLRGLRCRGPLAVEEGAYAIAFGGDPLRPSEQVVTRWCDPVDRAEQVDVLFCAGGVQVEDIDLMGNPMVMAIHDGMVPLVLARRPGRLRLTDTTAPVAVTGRLVRISGPMVVDPGDPITVELTNPTRASVTAESGFIGTALMAVTIPPGATVRVSLPAPVVSLGVAQVVWRFPTLGAGWSGTVAVPLMHAQQLSGAAVIGRAADFVIGQQADHIDNRYSLLLGADAMRWKGPHDCSAKVWLTREALDLVLQVEVLDDIHRQPFAREAQWRGDGLQFTLDRQGWTGFWELGVARLDDGRSEVVQWQTPLGGEHIAPQITATISHIPGGLLYVVRMPQAALLLDSDKLAAGFRFNLTVNDLDDSTQEQPLRESVVFLARGIHDAKDPRKWPLLRLKKADQ